MNRLVIIGNGFDLAHGLPTSYPEFIKNYIGNVSTILSKSSYDDGLIKVPFIQYLPDKNTNKFERSQADGRVRYYSTFINNIINKGLYNNWVDIENEYYTFLLDIVKSRSTDEESQKKILQNLNDAFGKLKAKLEEYLLREIEQSFTLSPDPSISSIFKDEIDKELMESPKVVIGEYPKKTVVLNFNYTSLAEKYCSRFPRDRKSIEHYYIHGKLNDFENPIIFGFGDEIDLNYQKIENLNNNQFFKNIKSFKYSRNSNYQNAISFLDLNDFQVYIMGHSCGLSDRTLLNHIFEHDNCRSIKIFYHKDLKGYNNTYYNISRHFNGKKAEMRMKVVPFDKSESLPQVKLERKDKVNNL